MGEKEKDFTFKYLLQTLQITCVLPEPSVFPVNKLLSHDHKERTKTKKAKQYYKQ